MEGIIGFRADPELRKAVEKLADLEDTTISGIMRRALTEYTYAQSKRTLGLFRISKDALKYSIQRLEDYDAERSGRMLKEADKYLDLTEKYNQLGRFFHLKEE